MKAILLSFLFVSTVIATKALPIDPSAVLRQDGVLTITDGSSYYSFNTNGVFRSFPVGWSGRCFIGSWTSTANMSLLHITATASIWWINGINSGHAEWRRIVFSVYPGTRKPSNLPVLDAHTGKIAKGLHPSIFDCYWIIDELSKIPEPAK